MQEAVRLGASFNVVHLATAVKIDVFVAADDLLDRERLRRRLRMTVRGEGGEVAMYVDTPEDVVLRKLEWFRRGGEQSERQWRDVVALLRIQRKLDQEYLNGWAARLRIEDLLSRAIRESAVQAE